MAVRGWVKVILWSCMYVSFMWNGGFVECCEYMVDSEMSVEWYGIELIVHTAVTWKLLNNIRIINKIINSEIKI